jgi:hypothetical protein
MEEEWKVIVEHPMFRVSSLGNVESRLSGEWRPRKLKRVNKGAKHGGRIYLGFNVPVGKLGSGCNKTVTLLVHNEVAKLFIGPRPPGMNVLHIDDDRTRNMVSNLKYGTQSENMKMAAQNGKVKYTRGADGKFRGS